MSAYDCLEPQASEKAKEQGLPHIEAYLLSVAISQKRIADALQFSIASINVSLTGLSTAVGSVIERPGTYSGQSPAAVRTKSG